MTLIAATFELHFDDLLDFDVEVALQVITAFAADEFKRELLMVKRLDLDNDIDYGALYVKQGFDPEHPDEYDERDDECGEC